MLYLVGPVGSGKSSIMESIKQALEKCQEIYALKDCPMREEPLHLVPNHLKTGLKNPGSQDRRRSLPGLPLQAQE